MKPFNLSNAAPLKSTEKKIAWYEKFWAGVSLMALFGEGITPKVAKDNLPVPVRNVIIIFLMLLIAYLACSGIYYNSMLLIDSTKGMSFSLGDNFYYYGFIAIVFIAMGYFNLEKEVTEHATRKKLLKEAAKDLGKTMPSIAPLTKAFNTTKSGSVIHALFAFLNIVWAIGGIIFYDTWLFAGIIALSLFFAILISVVKNIRQIRMILIIEIIATIILLSLILLNHFLNF